MKDYKLVEVRKGGVSITLVRRRGYHSIKEARRDYKEYARHRYQRGQRKRKYVIEFTEELLEPY